MASGEVRPSPDALLAEVRQRGRGRLKIFLGAAPGVGKTYEMLMQALQRHAEGVDVVIGIVETHGRKETQRLAEQLETLPRHELTYRGRQLQEFDIDALLARKPVLALVDELAHTNVPGSRHEKRWQDVEEILAAGIDVYTTLNVQHLASLNDVIARISRVTVRETVPDRVLENANQIELVDLPPEDLLRRLHEGKVYVPETAALAREHFFSPGTLTALRELALRAAAERVDADMLNWRRARGVDEPWDTQARLMVLIGNSPDSLRLVRLGKRLAERRDASWMVVNVARPGDIPERGEHAAGALALAEQLGAETVLLEGHDLVAAILEHANERNVTQIVVGRPARKVPLFEFRRSLPAALLRAARNIDVTIAATSEKPGTAAEPARRTPLSFRGSVGYLEALGATAVSTGIAWFLYPLLANANMGLVLLVGVLVTAIRAGTGPALFASGLSFLLFNFLFTEPRFTLAVSYDEDLLTIGFFLVVATVTGQLAARVRAQFESMQESNKRIVLLEEFSRRLAGIVSVEDLARVLDTYLKSALGLNALLVRKHFSTQLVVVTRPSERRPLGDTEQAAAEWAYLHRENAGLGTGTLPRSHMLFVPIIGKSGCLGVLGVTPVAARQPLDPARMRLLAAMRDQAGIALERLLLTAEIERNRLLIETDKLRSALLSSVSHDLRTPLVSIKGAASALVELESALGADEQRELLVNILEQTERLNRYVQNLLDMTRLGYGAIKPKPEWCDIRDIAAAAIGDLKSALASREVRVAVAEAEALVFTDHWLMEQVLVNLLENAAKYSDPGTPIRLEARRERDNFEVTVTDQGPGIPPDERSRVFDVFHRAQQVDQRSAGTGMGLAICKGMIEVLGGTIVVGTPGSGTGTTVIIRLPQAEMQPSIEAMER